VQDGDVGSLDAAAPQRLRGGVGLEHLVARGGRHTWEADALVPERGTPTAVDGRLLPGACIVTVGGPAFDPAGFCASVRELRTAGAFATVDVPRDGTLADELAARGVPEPLRRGSYLKLIVPTASPTSRRATATAPWRARVRGNTVILHVGRSSRTALRARFVFLDAQHRRVRLK
jgi:hypothetical protein